MVRSVKVATRLGRAFLMASGDIDDETPALMAALRQVSELLDRFEDDRST